MSWNVAEDFLYLYLRSVSIFPETVKLRHTSDPHPFASDLWLLLFRK